jgi:hypothetical protein
MYRPILLAALAGTSLLACGYQESHPTWRKGMNGVRTGHAIRTY